MEEVRDRVHQDGLRSKRGYKLSKSHLEKVLNNPFYYGYMKYNGLLYKHIHPALISKELCDECLRVRSGKRKTKYKRTEKPFILKGFITCQHCGCSYSPELKKGKYVYMRPTKSKGECSYCYHLNENAIISQIEDVLKGMKIHILNDINAELKKSSDKEHQHQVEEGKRLQQQYQATQTRIKRARELYLHASLSKEEYNEMMTDLQVERQNVETRISKLSNADDDFNKNVATIFELAAKAHDLFKSSELEEKRRIIGIMFPNLMMNGKKLVFKTREPFNMFLNLTDRQEWLTILYMFRTERYDEVMNFSKYYGSR